MCGFKVLLSLFSSSCNAILNYVDNKDGSRESNKDFSGFYLDCILEMGKQKRTRKLCRMLEMKLLCVLFMNRFLCAFCISCRVLFFFFFSLFQDLEFYNASLWLHFRCNKMFFLAFTVIRLKLEFGGNLSTWKGKSETRLSNRQHF